MTRVLPAHVVAAAAVVGLALSNFVRVSFGTSWVAALGALLVLAAVPRAGALVAADDLVAHCRSLIAGYKCPRTIEVRAEPLPLSAAGKVLKHVLREPYWQGRDRNVA